MVISSETIIDRKSSQERAVFVEAGFLLARREPVESEVPERWEEGPGLVVESQEFGCGPKPSLVETMALFVEGNFRAVAVGCRVIQPPDES